MKRKKIFVAVMGVTGAGKSTFIKAATGDHQIEVGHELTSCTSSVCPYSFAHEGIDIVLIDTPGFNDTFKSETEVLKEIASWLEKTYRDLNIKLSGIIYMHALEDRRMSGSSLRNLKMFRQLCGEQSMKNVIMVTSGWDLLRLTDQLDQGSAKETELITKKEFWQPMLSKGARVARFGNTKSSALDIISTLIPDPPTVLKIQHELVDDGKDLVDTAAGSSVNEELAKLQAKYESQLKDIQDEMAAARRDQDEEMRQILDEERAKFERMRDDARRAQDSLRYAQRNAQRKHENELQDVRNALHDSRAEAEAQRERHQRALLEAQAELLANKMEYEELVGHLRKNVGRLRREERAAVEAQIAHAEAEQKAETQKLQKQNLEMQKKKQQQTVAAADLKAKKKKRAYKLALNVVGIVGSVTMSALGLGMFSGPFQGLIDFNSSSGQHTTAAEDPPPAYEEA